MVKMPDVARVTTRRLEIVNCKIDKRFKTNEFKYDGGDSESETKEQLEDSAVK